MLGTKKQTFALDCGLGVAVKLIWLYFTTQLKLFFLSTEIKYATINSSQKKKDQLLSFKRKRPYLSGSLSLRTSCTLKNNNTTNCSFFPKLFSTLDAFITYSRTPGKNRKKY